MTIIITRPEVARSSLRTKVNELLVCMDMDSKRNETIEKLLIEKDAAIQEMYRFSYGVRSYEEGVMGYTSDPFFHTVNIIAIKERYAKRIARYKLKYERFNTIVNLLPSEDKEILIRAFSTDLPVDERDVKNVIRKHLKLIEQYYDLT